MSDLEETKRINKELLKIYQEQEQISHQDNNERHRQYQSARPSSVASSTSLNFGRQQMASSVIKQIAGVGPSLNSQHHHVPPPEPDKLMSYEQAMIYAHPALKDACKYFQFYKNEILKFILIVVRLAHRRKMSSKNSGTITSK
jgi:hypothetical protein